MEGNHPFHQNPYPYPHYYGQNYQFQPPPPHFQPFLHPLPFPTQPNLTPYTEQTAQFNAYTCPPPPGTSPNITQSDAVSTTDFPISVASPAPEKPPMPANERKRPRPPSPEPNDGGYTKLYVAPVPRTITTEDMWPLFQQYGNVIEVVFPMDKKQRLRGEYCFVKYSNREEADKAIKALNGIYTIPGEALPIVVRYADMRRETVSKVEVERAGGAGEKLYVGGINKQASKQEIRELFSVYGNVEDIYIGRDEMKQSRGFAFVKFSHLDMAMAAIKDMHGIFTMRGCDQPLVVRFADPIRPRALGGFADGPEGPNWSHPFQDSSDHTIEQNPSFDARKQFQRDNSYEATPDWSDSADCDWSEHTCPDGFKYYYNCITCESKWEMPEEFALFLQKQSFVQTC